MKLLKEIKRCPYCFRDKRLMNGICQAQKDLGNMDKAVVGATHVDVYCNIDPTKPVISGGRMAAARVFRDICGNCGREYVVRIEVGYLTTPTRPGSPATFT